MARIYLVRHGEVEGKWGEELDPGLNERGRAQAEGVARALASLGPLPVISSPFLRAQETALPLAETWRTRPLTDERVGEIPSPTENLAERMQFLKTVMGEKWPNLGQKHQAWRKRVIELYFGLGEDTVVFSHSVAINVAVGEATRDERVICFWPENGSVTTIVVNGSRLELVERGLEAAVDKGSKPKIL